MGFTQFAFWFYLSCSMIMSIWSNESSNKLIFIGNDFQSKNLLESVIFLEDKNKIFNIDDINESLTNNASIWSTTREKELSFGFTKSAYWIHFSLKNESKSLSKLILECNLATLDKIEIFYLGSNGKFIQNIAGDMQPFRERELKFRTNVFSIPIKSNEIKNIFIRLENEGPMKFGLVLYSADNFADYIASDQVLLGIYYGIMIVIIFYNLFLFFSIRDITYLYYIFYVIHIAIYQFIISGNAAQFIFSDNPDLANRAPNFVANLSFIAALIFTKFFLNTKFFVPFLNRIIIILIGLLTGYLFVILIVGHEMILLKTSNLLGLMMIIIIITSAVQVIRKGYRPALFFLFGWSFLLVTVFIQIMANLGAFNITAEHMGQIGSSVEVILLSFALADRMKQANIIKPLSPSGSREKVDETNRKEASLRPAFAILQIKYGLTYQQAQVCSALIDGKSRAEIASELEISLNTLKKHFSEIYGKTINKIDNSNIPAQEKLQKLTIFLRDLKN